MLKAINARGLAICLGILWLIDGLAQLQPKMFTSQFPSQVVTPSGVGQPGFVSGLIHFSVHIFLINPVLFNSFILAAQLSLGVLILNRATSLIGLKLSVLWGLFVWIVGEGYGGLFGFNANLLGGFPGAALIYVFLALGAIALNKKDNNERSFKGYWLYLVWAGTWVAGGIYQLLSAQSSLNMFISMVNGSRGQPGWLYSIKTNFASSLTNLMPVGHQAMSMNSANSSGGYWFILVLAVIEITIGLCIFIPKKISWFFISSGILLSLLFWVVGQELGGYYTGTATDLNTAPLIILLGLVILGFSRKDEYMKSLYKRVESILV